MAERKLSSPPPKLADNALVRGREFNRLVADVVSQSADAGLAVQPEQVQDFADAGKMLVRITGKGQTTTSEPWSYGGSEVIQQDDGTLVDRPIPTQFKIGSIGSAFYPLREKSGNPSVPIDGSVIVEVEPSGSGSFMTFDYAAVDHWFELTGSSGALYAWSKKYPALGGGFLDLINPYTGVVFTGTTTQNPLREIHGVTGLVAGTIVRAWHGGCSGAPQVVIGRQQMGDSDTLHEIQTVYIKGATAGTYVIDGDTLAWNHNAAALQAAIAGTTVTGSGTEGSPWLVEWTDFLPHDLLEADRGLLLGDQEWLCDCLYGGNVLFGNVTLGNLTILGTTIGAGITVQQVTGGSVLTDITTLKFDNADGVGVTTDGAGIARIDISAAGASNSGVMSAAAQTLGGDKTFDGYIHAKSGRIWIGPTSGTPTGSTCASILSAGDALAVAAVKDAGATTFSELYLFFEPPDLTGGAHAGGTIDLRVNRAGAGSTTPALSVSGQRGGGATTGGLTFFGGLYISGTATITVGQTVSGGTTGGILFPNAGILDDSPDLIFDQALPALTLGGGGYLVTTKTSAPSGIPTNSIAGPFLTD